MAFEHKKEILKYSKETIK